MLEQAAIEIGLVEVGRIGLSEDGLVGGQGLLDGFDLAEESGDRFRFLRIFLGDRFRQILWRRFELVDASAEVERPAMALEEAGAGYFELPCVILSGGLLAELVVPVGAQFGAPSPGCGGGGGEPVKGGEFAHGEVNCTVGPIPLHGKDSGAESCGLKRLKCCERWGKVGRSYSLQRRNVVLGQQSLRRVVAKRGRRYRGRFYAFRDSDTGTPGGEALRSGA